MPDSREVTATVVVNFGQGAASDNDALVAEIDSRETGLNAGKTTFLPGEDVWILVYPSSNVVLNTPVTSWGDLVRRAGTELVDKEQDLQFIDEVEGVVAWPILDGFTPTFIGRDASPVVQAGDMTLRIATPAAVDHYARVLRVNWVAEAIAYRLTNTEISGLDEYQIVVHFTGVAS